MPPTTIYKQGEVVLAHFPFTDSTSTKQRPAIVISANWYNRGKGKYILIAITSVIPPILDKDEILLRGRDYQEAGLIRESIVRCGLIFTLNNERVVKRLGTLPRGTFDQILLRITELFNDS